MAHAKKGLKRTRRRTGLPALGAAGMSLSLAGGASAAVAPTTDVASQDAMSRPVILLGEEEISDVSLGTFYVLDTEDAGASLGVKLARAGGCGGCGGCRGGGGCAARGCGGGGCAARGCGVRGAVACAVGRCAVGRCAVGRCAVGRCAVVGRCRCGCGVGFVGCAGWGVWGGCGGGCGTCWQWNGWTWVQVC